MEILRYLYPEGYVLPSLPAILIWYPAILQFCDSIIWIAYHTAVHKYGYTIIHSCDGGDSSHPVTDHDITRKKATAAEKKRMAGTITEWQIPTNNRLFGNQINRKSGTCEFRQSSRMVICQRGFWNNWNTDKEKAKSGIRMLSYTHSLPYRCSDSHIWLSVHSAISLFR